MNPEQQRLADVNRSWRKWGPYLAERQWGTVREDYSSNGDAWGYFSHEQSRKRAYRWGEDGLAGFSDDRQTICLSLALWNERDAILKERLFGLTGHEGNHGEDVKEIYYYLDATPSHSYLRMLYKYPQHAFPYDELVERNRRAGKQAGEYELTDTYAFDEDRYFDVFVEYSKADVEDILMRITVHNRGPDAARLHVLPQVCFRNTWSWGIEGETKPQIDLEANHIRLNHVDLGAYRMYADGASEWLFCDNETDHQSVFGIPSAPGYFKDAFHKYVVEGDGSAVNPQNQGTKCAARWQLLIAAGGQATVNVRLTRAHLDQPFADFDDLMQSRVDEADQYYRQLQTRLCDDEERCRIQRQAFAGLIWTKQFYNYEVTDWLAGDSSQPTPPKSRLQGRNREWLHLHNADVISMPDKWEYPWYAAWDLAFHCLPLAIIDSEFAKRQLVLMTREWYMHPNGQIPAYEWSFSDVNPPVHAWATWRVYQIDRRRNGRPDRAFLERVFHKLLLNFTWWVNRKDEENRNVFQGGFLGLDNIGVFDRSKALPGGGKLDQADATSWMAMYSLNMMRIALELANENPVYEDIANKFFEHFLFIAKAMNDLGGRGIGLWDQEDEFYYDVLHTPNGEMIPLKVRSLVGLTPLFAVETLEPEMLRRMKYFASRQEWFLRNRPDLAKLVSRWYEPGRGERRLLSLLRGHRMKCLLRRLLDEAEFLSEYGIRALSKYHQEHPFRFKSDDHRMQGYGDDLTVAYEPGESTSHMFGGNSNWRGPIWLPMNFLIIEALQKFHHYYGDDFKVEYPTHSGNYTTIYRIAEHLTERLIRLFLRDDNGCRPIYHGQPRFQSDRNFSDHLLFYEYFHGDDGRGLGASHQTGWTALIAKLLQPRRAPY